MLLNQSQSQHNTFCKSASSFLLLNWFNGDGCKGRGGSFVHWKMFLLATGSVLLTVDEAINILCMNAAIQTARLFCSEVGKISSLCV